MYMLKTKRNSELIEPSGSGENSPQGEDMLDGKSKFLFKRSSNESIGSKNSKASEDIGFNPDELPDGSCISPQRLIHTYKDTEHSAVRPAQVRTRLKTWLKFCGLLLKQVCIVANGGFQHSHLTAGKSCNQLTASLVHGNQGNSNN